MINSKSKYLKFFFFITSSLVIALLITSLSFGEERLPWNDSNLKKIKSLSYDIDKPMRFVVVGDTRSNMKKFSEIISLTNSLKPDFIIHLGDIVERGEKTEYIKILPYFEKFNSPVIAVPGNHEVSKSKKNLENFEHYFGAKEFMFELKNIRFILVNNAMGYLSKNQLKEIEKNLNCDKTRMLYMHSPPSTVYPKHTFNSGAKELVDIIRKSGCEYAFFGHVHGYDYRMIGDKCHAYITGGGGAELNGYGFAKEIYHVLLVTVDNGKINVEMVPLK